MLTQSTFAISKDHGLLQAARLQLSGPGYDLLPFELEAAQPSRIKVQTGDSTMPNAPTLKSWPMTAC